MIRILRSPSLTTRALRLQQSTISSSKQLDTNTMTTAEQAEVLEKASEHWHESDIAAKYSRAESATRPYAEIMVQKAGIDKLEGEANVLDLACGSGAVTAAIYKALPKQKWDSVKVLGGDISQGMLDYLKARGKKEGWKGLETKIVDGTVR